MAEAPSRPLDSETWAGCVDAVGGAMLARVLTQMKYGCSVAAVGLAGGAKVPATVVPFLLRGVKLDTGVPGPVVNSTCPFDGPLVLRVEGKERTVGEKIANQIFVKKVS